MRQKAFGALMPRKGAPGWSDAYEKVMNVHAVQMYRSQSLSKMNHDIIPLIEQIAVDKPGLADAMRLHVEALWGTPSMVEKAFGNLIRQVPVLRNHVAAPDFAFRGLAQRLMELQMLGKLKLSPRSALVNRLQRYATLWPFIATKDLLALEAEFAKPKTRQWLTDRGVFRGATKLETPGGGTYRGGTSTFNPLTWFQRASESNKGVGYLYGYRKALSRGLSQEAAHWNGLSWAEKVEFDNSVYNIQPVLRTPTMRLFGQFKSFAGKNLENMREVFLSGDVPRSQRAARIAKWMGTQGAIGGVRSFGALTKLAGAYLIVQQLSHQLQQLGMGQGEADRLAETVYFGAPSLIGQDLSASVMVLEPPYGTTPEEQIVNFAFGPTVGTALAGIKGWEQKDIRPFAKGLTTAYRTYEVIEQAIAGEGETVKVGRSQYVELTPFEAVMRALGFTPVKQTRVYEKRKAGIKEGGPGNWSLPSFGRSLPGLPTSPTRR